MLKKKAVLSDTVYTVRVLLRSDAGRANQLLEGKAGLEKRSHTSLQRAWRIPRRAGLKSCSNIHLVLELGCDDRPCPAPRTAPGRSQGSGKLEGFVRAGWAIPEAPGKR